MKNKLYFLVFMAVLLASGVYSQAVDYLYTGRGTYDYDYLCGKSAGGDIRHDGQIFVFPNASTILGFYYGVRKVGTPVDATMILYKNGAAAGVQVTNCTMLATSVGATNAYVGCNWTTPQTLTANMPYEVHCFADASANGNYYFVQGANNDSYSGGYFESWYTSAWHNITGGDLDLKVIVQLSSSGVPPALNSISTGIGNNTQWGYIKEPDGILDFSINASVTNCSNAFNGSVLKNNSFLYSITNMNLSLNPQFNFTFDNLEQTFNLTFNLTNSQCSGTAYLINISVDGIYPEVNSTLVNNSIYYKLARSIVYNISEQFADSNLYATNVTIFNYTGGLYYNHFDSEPSFFEPTATNNQVNHTIIPDGMNVGRFNLTLEAWDSHTAIELNAEPVLKDSRGLIIEMPKAELGAEVILPKDTAATYLEYKGIEFYCNNAKISYILEKDRVKPIAEFTGENTEERCYYSGYDFKKVENSPYKNHFVDLTKGIWLDEYTGDITQLSPTILEITYKSSSGLEKVITDSIGDLNYISEVYYFNISAPYTIYARDSYTGAYIYGFNISLYNSTGGLVYQYNTSSNNLTLPIYTGSYNITASAESYLTNTTEFTATLGGNTSIYLTASESLYLIFYDEYTDLLLNTTTINLDVINFENVSYSYTTTNGIKFIAGFAPGNYEIRYRAEGYNPRTYYTTITTGTTQQVRLYLLNSSVATYTIFTIEDESGNLLENATLSATRFFVGCNCYRVVEMDKSNFNGEATLSLEHYTTRYNFIVTYKGSNVYTSTAGYRLTGSSYTLKANLITDTTISFFGKNAFYTNLSYNNNTKIITYIASDTTSLLKEFCLIVEQPDSSAQGYALLYNGCLEATSGILTFNITNITNGKEVIARGLIETNTNYSTYYSDIITIYTSHASKFALGNMGLFMGAILVLTIGFMGLIIGGMQLGILTTMLGLALTKILGLIEISLGILTGVIIVGLIIVYLVGEDG